MYSFISFIKVILYMMVIQGGVKVLKNPYKNRDFLDKLFPVIIILVGVVGFYMEVSSWF